MIKNIFINGFPVALDGVRHITAASGLTSSTIDLSTYSRGGRNGVVLGNPFYRSRSFTIEVTILASEPTSLIKEKDRLITALRLAQSEINKFKFVEFEMHDGHRRSCRAIVNKIDGNLTPETSYAQTKLSFQMITERWYLEGENHLTKLAPQNFGGMSVPMSVPMNMAVKGNSNEESQVVNNGNTESLPLFHIVGPFTSCDIYNSTVDQHLSITTNLGEGETLDLDCFNHTAIKNQVSNVRGSISGDWIIVAPGQNRILFSAAAGQQGNGAEIDFRDAYTGI